MADPVVKTQCGLIRGVVEKHEDGFDYYAFKGVPYAEPPIGELRFEDPVPKKEWTGEIDCTKYNPICLQNNFIFNIHSNNEDCLRLNVYTRSIDKQNVNKPVIMVIHVGGFIMGSGDDFIHGPEYLIREDVVLVMTNQRLGVLGYLNLEDEVAPGMQGHKDQVMALQWIHQNIRLFGGDPNNITAFGVASGGSIAHALALSPLSKGLIHKVIAQGTSLYTPWVYVKNSRSNAIKLCSLLGKELTDSKEIVRFLKTVDAEKLQEAQDKLRTLISGIVFGPGEDSQSSKSFMPVSHIAMANQGFHLPCLTGYNSYEGVIFLSEDALLLGNPIKDIFNVCDRNFSKTLKYNTEDITKFYDLTEMQIRKLYFKDDAVSEQTMDQFIELTSDFYFKWGIHQLVKVQAETSSAATYLYQFGYNAPQKLSQIGTKITNIGPSHLDDVPFLFKMHAFESLGLEYFEKGSKQYRIMEQMVKMWTNFAKYGRPTIEKNELIPVHWQPNMDGTVLRYLDVDCDVSMKTTINMEEKLLSAKDIAV